MYSKDRLARLNGYQIAGVAAVTSTVAAVIVLLAVRRIVKSWAARVLERQGDPVRDPGHVTEATMEQPVPDHFSETIIIPGLTETGSEIAQQDATDGHAPEGV